MYARPYFTLPPAGWHPGMIGRPGMRGLGLNTSALPGVATSAATTGLSIYAALVATGSAAGPIGAAIGGVIALGVAIDKLVQGCGQTCIEATSVVNQIEPLLSQNVHNYVSQPVRTQSMQTAALGVFTGAWNQVLQMCGNPQLAQAGRNCISQRQQGACAYKTSPGGWAQNASGVWVYTFPGANGSGSACWNWFVGYSDPIANDPDVQPDSALSSSTAASATGSAGSTGSPATSTNYTPLILAAAVLAGVLLLQ